MELKYTTQRRLPSSKQNSETMLMPNKGILTERERLSTVDLLVLTSSDQLFLLAKNIFPFYRTSYLKEEVNCTEPSLSVIVSLARPSTIF